LTVIFPEEAMAVLETLIFVSSKPVTAATLSRITGYAEEDVEMLLDRLAELYEQPGHGLKLSRVAGVISWLPVLNTHHMWKKC